MLLKVNGVLFFLTPATSTNNNLCKQHKAAKFDVSAARVKLFSHFADSFMTNVTFIAIFLCFCQPSETLLGRLFVFISEVAHCSP